MEQDKTYSDALDKAFEEWRGLQEEEKRLAVRKAQIQESIRALFPLVWPEANVVDWSTLTLANAIRLVINGIDRPITAIEMRGRLKDFGFDLSKYENALASIHTAMRRMAEAEEIVYVNEADEKMKVAPGPQLKSVPLPEPKPSDDPKQSAIAEMLANLYTEGKK